MKRLLPTFLAAAAVTATAAAAVAPAAIAQSASTDLTRAYTLRTVSAPIPALPNARAEAIRTRLMFPSTWRRVGRVGETLRLRVNRNSICQYTVRVRNEIVVSPQSTAAGLAAELLPQTGSRVLESGTRNSAAWRVTRPQVAARQIDVEGVRVIAHFTDRNAGVPAGQRAYLVTRVSAVSDVGDECHSGTYRVTVGPAIGDALATERSQAYVRPATS